MKCPYCKSQMPIQSNQISDTATCEVCNATISLQAEEVRIKHIKETAKSRLIARLSVSAIFVAGLILQFFIIRRKADSNGFEYLALIAVIPFIYGIIVAFAHVDTLEDIEDRFGPLRWIFAILLLPIGIIFFTMGRPSASQTRAKGIIELFLGLFIVYSALILALASQMQAL